MKLLLIEDDVQVRDFVTKGMTESGHVVDTSDNGEDGLHLAVSNKYDVIILDRMLPMMDGLSVLKNIRGSGNSTPVIVLSALGEVDDRVQGLRSGGDDYLTKPFDFIELLARVEVLGRRSKSVSNQQTKLSFHNVELDLLSRKVTCNGSVVDLQTREFNLLEYLIKHQGQVVTRTMLLEAVWDYNFDPQTNVIDVHISRLRKKIGDLGCNIIKTVRGAGYIVEESI